MKNDHKVLSVIIPVFNEEKTLKTLLDRVASAAVPVSMEIIVVNDGSTDHSPEICRQWIAENRNRLPHRLILLEKENGGKGSAVKAGIKISTGDVVIIQDADLEYDPNDYVKCITPILHGECKVVYGSREADNRNRCFSAPSFFLGGLLLTEWIDLLYNAELTDEPTCYKTFDGPLIRSLEIQGDKFEWEPEVTAKLLRLGFEIREVPVRYYPRKLKEGKKIKWRDGLQGLWIALYWRFAAMKNIRNKIRTVSGFCANTISMQRRERRWLLAIFLLAFLIRLLPALPGLYTPGQQPLMRPESRSFLAIAGPGIFERLPAFHQLYPQFLLDPQKKLPMENLSLQNQTRSPLYPLWLSFLFGISHRSLIFAAVMGCLLGASICGIVFLCGHLFGSPGIGRTAAILLALNPNAIVYSPVFLPDTLFTLIAAMQCWFFLRFVKNSFGLNLILSVIFAALGALIRPVNALWIFPCVIVLFFHHRTELRLRLNYMCAALLLFGLILFPWIYSAQASGLGWRIDTVSSDALMKNTAALEAGLQKSSPARVRLAYQAELRQRFRAEPQRFQTVGAQLDEQDRMMFRKIFQHPFRYLCSHWNPAILRQDLVGLFHNAGYYRKPSQNLTSLVSVWSLLWFMAVFVGLGWFLLAVIDRKNIFALLLFLLFPGYYLLMPGAIAAARYQLPALPFLCLAAGYGLTVFRAVIKEQKLPSGL